VVVTTALTHGLQVLDTITINGTGTELDGGNFSIKAKTTLTLTLDFKTNDSSNTGTVKKYFNNYKGLVKVFVGAPDQHPYNLDGSKPLIEAGIIEVDFVYDAVQDKNIGLVNVNSYVKVDISPKFDTEENTHYGWGSYYIQYAESYDVSDGSDITTFQSSFTDDLQDGCGVFADFLNPSFDNGLDDWLQECTVGSCDAWIAGVGSVSYSDSFKSNVLFQEKALYSGVPYDLSLDFNVNVGTNRVIILIYGFNGSDWNPLNVDTNYPPLGASIRNYSITPLEDIQKIGVVFAPNSSTINITLNSFNISTNVAQPCLFTQWANFGTKQFQDSLGANFGDYVLNVVDSITPKILTHFDEKTYFEGNPVYFSAIIPDSTFSLSQSGNSVFVVVTHFDEKTYFEGNPVYFSAIIPDSTFSLSQSGNSVFVVVELFDESGNIVLSYNKRVIQKGEGVYTTDLDIAFFLSVNNLSSNSWSTGTARYIIVPANTFIDAINGTFEDANSINWNLTLLNATPNEIGVSISTFTGSKTGSLAGLIQWDAPSMNEVNKVYSLFENDNGLNVVEGREYQISSYLSIRETLFEPSQEDNASFFWLPNGYTKEECSVVAWELIAKNIAPAMDPVTPSDYSETVTTFIAKTTETLKLTFYEELIVDRNSATGGSIYMDDITFKGPFEYISEAKPIKNSCSCTLYGGTLRWLNDLNGWELWYFNKKKIDKERVTGKINIVRDLTIDWDDSFINGETQGDTIKTTVNKSTVLRSQLLTTNEKKVLEQIKRSARVQILMDSGKWQTVTIRPSMANGNN